MSRTVLRFICITAILAFACGTSIVACSSSDAANTRNDAADEGLALLHNMADGSDYAFYGYESESDVGSEELGDPFEVKELDIDTLIAVETPTDSLIIETNQFLFPVLVHDSPIQAILVELMSDEGEWEYISTESKDTVEAAQQMITANLLSREECFLLDLEEIELMFLGYAESGHIILIPLFTSSTSTLTVGAKYVFTEIAPQIKTEILAAEAAYNDMIPAESENISSSMSEQTSISKNYTFTTKTERLINISLISQEEDQWCWAATGRMTMLYAGGDASAITQCAQANSAFSETSCCDDGSTASCNKPYRPRYDSWGFAATQVFDPNGASLSWEEFKAQMDAGKPVAFLWRWRHGGGHYMVAVGYYEDTTTSPPIRIVLINNPWPPNVGKRESITYSKWVGGTRYNNTQTCFFYNITKK